MSNSSNNDDNEQALAGFIGMLLIIVGIIWGIGPFYKLQYKKEKHVNTTNHYQPSFTGNYSDSEISKMKKDVEDCEYKVSLLGDKVHHHENMVSLSNTPAGIETGDYSYELSTLSKIKIEYNNALSRLAEAKSRLNNARDY